MPNVKRLKVERGPVSAGASGGGDPPEDRNNGEKRLMGHYTERNKPTTKSKTAMERRRSARMSTTSRRATTSRMNSISKKRHNNTNESSESSGEESEEDLSYEGLQVVEAPRHEVEYDQPLFYQAGMGYEDDDEALEARLQFSVDRAMYVNGEEGHERDQVVEEGSSVNGSEEEDEDDIEYFELNDVSARIDAAYDAYEECWEFMNINNDNPRDEYIESGFPIAGRVLNTESGFPVADIVHNTESSALNNDDPDILSDDTLPIEASSSDISIMENMELGDGDEEADVVVDVVVNPLVHTQIYYETDRWTCLVDSRYPVLTDMLEERRFVPGVQGMFRVPFNEIWQLIAHSGLGQNGWPYSVIHQTAVFRSDGWGPI